VIQRGFVIVACAAALPFAAACHDVRAADRTMALASDDDFVAGQIIVWFVDGTSNADIAAAVKAVGGELMEQSGVTPTRVIIAVPPGEEDKFVEAYRALAAVRAADKNYKVKAFGCGAAPLK